MSKLVWIVVFVVSVVLAGCAAPMPTNTPLPTSTPTWTPAPTSTPPPPPTQTPVPTLTPTPAPTRTLVPTPAPAATQPSTATLPLTLTAEELVGIWQAGDRWYAELKRDGTWGLAAYPQFLKAAQYEVEGKFGVEGDLLTLSDTALCEGAIGVYRLESKAEGKLTFALVKDDCKTSQEQAAIFYNFQRWAAFASLLERVP
jgi:hypothetical protein